MRVLYFEIFFFFNYFLLSLNLKAKFKIIIFLEKLNGVYDFCTLKKYKISEKSSLFLKKSQKNIISSN